MTETETQKWSTEDILAWHRQYYLNVRLLPDKKRWTCIAMLTCGQGRICVSRLEDTRGIDDGYCYETLEAALAASQVWSGVTGTEPDGWVRAYSIHYRGYRRRPDGTAASEYLDLGR